MVKNIHIDARNNPKLERQAFSIVMGVEPLPDELSGRLSGREIVEDIAKKVGVSMPEATRMVGKIMQREILTEGVNQKMRQSFNDPLDIRRDNGRMPSFTEVMQRAGKFDNSTERAEFAAQRIKDARAKPPIDPAVLAEIRGNAGKAAVGEFLKWAEEGESKDTVLQAVQISSLHKLQAAYAAKCVLTLDRADDDAQMVKLLPAYVHFFKEDPQVFLVQHDWATAFDKAEGIDGEVPLPFGFCAFEFQVSGRRLIVLCREGFGSIFVELSGSPYWYAGRIDTLEDMATRETDEPGTFSQLGIMLALNIRAICIALDAEVVVTEVVRAPHRLNHQREKQGKKPVLDHHVINLARRSRVEALPSAGEHEAKWHPRLHFRRGHWRHFTDHKTWIKWMLVGDVDLGFIDKEYRA